MESCIQTFETKTYFFIYISNMQAFVIFKTGIFNCSAEELRDMLRKSVEEKFKTYAR